MKPVIYLRVASVLTLMHAMLHTVGGVFGKPAPGLGAATAAVMQANRFLALGGVTRSYWDFYRGLGLGITIMLTAEGIVFWLLSSLAKNDALRLRPILWVFLAAYLAFAVNSYTYFFYGPVIVEILIAAFLLLAIASAAPGSIKQPLSGAEVPGGS